MNDEQQGIILDGPSRKEGIVLNGPPKKGIVLIDSEGAQERNEIMLLDSEPAKHEQWQLPEEQDALRNYRSREID